MPVDKDTRADWGKIVDNPAVVKRCNRTTEATRICYIHSGDDKESRLL